MANIYESVNKSSDRRPVFTSYELSDMVKRTIEDSGMAVSEYAAGKGISEDVLEKVLSAKGSFSPKMYKVCGSVLGLSMEQILAETVDTGIVSYRASEDNCNVQATCALANNLFNEIIMQRKIRVC